MRIAIGLLLVLVGLTAQAQVYKWVDKNGVVHYTDKPPSQNAVPAKLPPLQTFKGGAVPNLDNLKSSREAAAPLGAVKVRIVTPTPNETFRNDSGGQVNVSVLVSPGLQEDQRLMYYLNGIAQGAPTREYALTVKDLERGSHNIAVAVVEGQKEISRSETVTIHFRQATVRP